MKKKLLYLFAIPLLLVSCGGNSSKPTSISSKNGNSSTSIQIASEQSSSISSQSSKAEEENIKLSFKSASSYEYLNNINKKKVVIRGYMATSSPVDGSFIFLMNLPYQNCPFCKPNTSQLSNTIEVYPKKNEKFSYTTSAIEVVGTLLVSDNPNIPFTDPYGYEFNFKLIDAEYRILKDSDISGNILLWQKFANSDMITKIYAMYDYVNFLCDWPNYFVNSYTDSKGQYHVGYYLYPSDALYYIQTDGGQWNYGYQDGYFDGLITKINKISSTGFESLIQNIKKAEKLAEYALGELTQEHYSSERKYVEKFDTYDYIFTLNDDEIAKKFNDIYSEFTEWLASFEM